MNCLPCFGSKDSEINEPENRSPLAQAKQNPYSQPPVITMESPSGGAAIQPMNNQNKENVATEMNETNEVAVNSARNFGFRELAMATKNFRRETLIGESRLGKVYKGTIQGSGQVVAVKQLDKHGTKANKEFLAEVMMLSLLRHPNLVELIGYCADGDQRILVYEYMEMGSISNHLHEVPPEKEPLTWITRMKIASGAALALEYLHEEANPPILYRNFTSTNILLDENLEPKLTDYGMVRLEVDAGNNMQQRIVGTVGCAPEYEQNGDLTKKSDVYSFGVVLLELITGRKTLDTTRPIDEQNLIIWAQPYFKEPKRFPEMADPQLKGSFPAKSLNQAVGVAAMCVQDDPSVRPMMSDVVAALSFLTLPDQPLQPQAQTEPCTTASTDDPRMEKRPSCSLSSSSVEGEEDLETSSSQNEDFSCSDSEDEDEQPPMRIKNNKTGYDEDKCGTSSSESLYNEDDYWEDDQNQQEETNCYRSKSKPKSIKRKVTFGRDKGGVSRTSSKASKKHSDSSFRKKCVSRKSSKNNDNVDVIGNHPSSSKRHESSSKLKKGESSESSSFSSDSGDGSRRVVASGTRRKSSDVEILDGGEGINARLLEDTYVPI